MEILRQTTLESVTDMEKTSSTDIPWPLHGAENSTAVSVACSWQDLRAWAERELFLEDHEAGEAPEAGGTRGTREAQEAQGVRVRVRVGVVC